MKFCVSKKKNNFRRTAFFTFVRFLLKRSILIKYIFTQKYTKVIQMSKHISAIGNNYNKDFICVSLRLFYIIFRVIYLTLNGEKTRKNVHSESSKIIRITPIPHSNFILNPFLSLSHCWTFVNIEPLNKTYRICTLLSQNLEIKIIAIYFSPIHCVLFSIFLVTPTEIHTPNLYIDTDNCFNNRLCVH